MRRRSARAAVPAPRWRWSLACALLALLGFVALGIWQVQRLGWKLELIARVDQRVNCGPSRCRRRRPDALAR